MIRRLSFATRIGLIVVASVAAVWIGALALFFVSQSRGAAAARPLPAQIVAIVDLLERTPPDRQQAVIDAVTSDTLRARLADREDLGPSSRRPLVRAGERALERYLAVLGGRRLSVTLPDAKVAGGGRWFARMAPDALEFRIALKTDQTLVLDTRSTAIVSLFGLPLGFGAGLFGSAIALVALYVLHRETRPLARLAAAVDRIDLEHLGEPLAASLTAPARAPEIGALIAAFDRLQTRLGTLLKARMAMMGGISHDVRTFATRLALRVDAIPDDTQRRLAVRDIDDMIRLLDDGLLASRAGAGELACELVDVDEIVRAEAADRIANGAPVAIGARPDGPLKILGDRLALRRIAANLLDNAVKYGHRATIAVTRDGDWIQLVVDDAGPGIPVDQRALLLEPFVRLETSRNRASGGAGLGLAIVRNLALAQGGTIVIEDGPEGGARVVVRLPAFVDGASPAAD